MLGVSSQRCPQEQVTLISSTVRVQYQGRSQTVQRLREANGRKAPASLTRFRVRRHGVWHSKVSTVKLGYSGRPKSALGLRYSQVSVVLYSIQVGLGVYVDL